LTGSFDRKELKKRYTDLIRRYKPERHPNEFQHIRAAYEALDARLRYGQQERANEAAFDQEWRSDESPARPSRSRRPGDAARSASQPVPPEPAQAQSLSERLDHEAPKRLYEELQQRASKSAYDYYALAVLADVVEPDNRLGFVRWILAGVKAFPRESALSTLLRELLWQCDFADANADVLLAVSQVLASDRFYYFTEPLWDRFLKSSASDRFAELLKQCEHNVRDHRIGAKVTFYVHILRTALWRGDEEWVEGALAFLKDHPDQIRGELEYEMEFNWQLIRYYRSAHAFVDGSPERNSINRCIREFCTLDEPTAADRLVQNQLALAANPQGLLNALPFDQADHSAAYGALRWIMYETNSRLGIDWPEPNGEKLWDRTVQFMSEVDATDDLNAWQLNSVYKGFVEVFGLFVLSIFSSVIMFMLAELINTALPIRRQDADISRVVAVIAGIGGTVAFCLAYLRKRTTDRWFARRRQRIALRKYRRHWRGQTLRFLQDTQYPLDDIRATITAAVQQHPGVFAASTWLPGFLSQDFGLAFYSLAHSYMR
jgi:hypothetical protein